MTLIHRSGATWRMIRTGLLAGLLLLACGATARPAEPGQAPARLVPARGLTFYVEYDGVGPGHAEAWKVTAAYAVLNRTPAGEALTGVARQLCDQFLKETPEVKLTRSDVASLCDHMSRHGFVLAVYAQKEAPDAAVLVLNGLGRPGVRERVDAVLRLLWPPKDDGGRPEVVQVRGRVLHQVPYQSAAAAVQVSVPVGVPIAAAGPEPKPPDDRQQERATSLLTWWFEGDDLILTDAPPLGQPAKPADEKAGGVPRAWDGAAAVLDAVDGVRPSALTHPGRAAALDEGRDIAGFAPNGLFFVGTDEDNLPPQGLLEQLDGLLGLIEGLLGDLPAALLPVAGVPIPAFGIGQVQFQPVSPPVSGVPGLPSPGLLPAPAPAAPPAEPVPARIYEGPGFVRVPAQIGVPAAPGPVVPQVPPPAAAPVAPAEPAAPANRDPAQAAEALKRLGLDRLKRIVGRWGFRGKALLTDVRIEVPAPRTGLMSLLDQPGVRTDRLPPIPKGARALAIGSFDAGKSCDALEMLLPNLGGEVAGLLQSVDRAVREATGQRLREDLLAQVGPTWCLYTTPYLWDETDITAPALYVELRDAAAFGKHLDTLAAHVNQWLGAGKGEGVAGKPAGGAPAFVLERLPGPERGYRIVSPDGVVPWLSEDVQPTILLGRAYVVVAMNPALARLAVAAELRAEERFVPGDELAAALASLPGTVTSLSVGDPADSSWPDLLASLPRTVQYLGNLAGVPADAGAAGAGPASELLALLGIPQAGGFRVRIPPAKVPKARDIRDLLFPSVLATAVDDRGLRFIGSEALPFACVGYSRNGNSANAGKLNLDLDRLRSLRLP